jgi:terminase small subunit-like protein
MSDTMSHDPKPITPTRMGRPTSMTPEVIDRILLLLIEGFSVRQICEAADMPDRSTVMQHRWRDPKFNEQYLAAKAAGTECMVEDARALALNATSETANAVRVALDWVKFEVGRLASKRWGSDATIKAELSGPNGGAIQIAPARPPLVEPEIAAGIKALLADAESAVGIAPPEGADDATRLKSLMMSGSPLHPRLWAALRKDGAGHD